MGKVAAGCEFYDAGAAFRADADDLALFGEHIGDAARDGGSGVEPDDGPGRQRIQLVEQQRIMGTAQHDDIGSRSRLLYKARRDLAGDRVVLDNRATGAQFRQFRERGRTNEVKSRSSPELSINLRVYSRATVPGVASTETSPLFVREAAGLMAGTVPTNGIANAFGARGARRWWLYCRQGRCNPD